MRRALLLIATILLLLPATAAAAAPDAGVKLLDCTPAIESQERTATFEARVRRAHTSDRMQVRFTLQVREGSREGWHRVFADGFDEWLTSDSGVTRYSYSKTVENLSAPATYRMVVRFRWLAGDGSVLARSRATSRQCRQPDMRPDLRVTRIDLAAPGDYAVALRNAGRTAAGPFSVTLGSGGQVLAPIAVEGLEPGARQVLAFHGPACAAGAPLLATVDPDGAVEERDEDDNVLVGACPG
jgi:hypothetical protein